MFSELLKPVCQKHTLTNCSDSAKPSFKSLKCTAGRQRPAVNGSAVCERLRRFFRSYTKAETEHSVTGAFTGAEFRATLSITEYILCGRFMGVFLFIYTHFFLKFDLILSLHYILCEFHA